jgi:DnaJ domain
MIFALASKMNLKPQQFMPSHYDILQVSPEADTETIRAAYRTLARRYHPDLNPDDTWATDRMQQLNQAYGVLCNPPLREDYDKAHGFAGVPALAAKPHTTPPLHRHVTARQLWQPNLLASKSLKIFLLLAVGIFTFMMAAKWTLWEQPEMVAAPHSAPPVALRLDLSLLDREDLVSPQTD